MIAEKNKPRVTMIMPALLAPHHGHGRRSLWWLTTASAVITALVVGGLAWAYRPHDDPGTTSERALAVRRVHITHPRQAAVGSVQLPATLQPDQATDLYARVPGYLKAWHADLGARVETGQVLAEIDTPELDQEVRQAAAQLAQAKADLAQARTELEEANSDVELARANLNRAQASLDFSDSQRDRYRRLAASRTVSREELETIVRDHDSRKAESRAAQADLTRRQSNLTTRQAVIHSREAAVGSREANLRRLQELQGFRKVLVPFPGVVMRRSAEVGMLVSAGGQSLFRIVKGDLLRVQVSVPQAHAIGLRQGDQAEVLAPEYPARTFTARVSRTAHAVDPVSRTLLVELELPNGDGLLLPGSYGQVRLAARRTDAPVLVPASTLLMRTDGVHVAVVESGAVHIRKVQLGRDLGSTVEVQRGLAGGEALVVNPTDDLVDGESVLVQAPGRSE